jgi:alpha/beta superfamily hydrolase
MHHLLRLITLIALSACSAASAADYGREKNWAEQILQTLVVGDPVWLTQKNGHQFLTLFTEAPNAKVAIIVAHGRGWNPDFELYGTLRTKLVDEGFTTLSIQLPVLSGGAKVGDYIPEYPDATERFQIATKWLQAKGYKQIAIVSHSLGSTMTNEYLIADDKTPIGAWINISIINGLRAMYWINTPVLDIYGEKDWEVTLGGAAERMKQIARVKGSKQVMIKDGLHFFEGKENELVQVIKSFLVEHFAQS